MVIGTVAAVGAVVATAGAAAPAVAAAAGATGTAAGTAAGAAGATGASSTAAVLGGAAAGGVGGAGAAGMTAGGFALGPVGWIALGASIADEPPNDEKKGGAHTWDCWKPVLHDDSPEPSETGMLLKDVVSDPRVRLVKAEGLPLAEGQMEGTPDIVLENVWGEQFQIQFVLVGESGTLAAHANQIIAEDGGK